MIVVFLSDSHSDGTHPLQSIHCSDTDAVLHFSKSDRDVGVQFKTKFGSNIHLMQTASPVKSWIYI